MASYKQPCMHCGALLEREARFCPACGSNSPFGYLCPGCLKPVQKGQALCSCCGRALYTKCPHCGGDTFVEEACEKCGKSLLVRCKNKRCGQMQFFENKICTACGKKLTPGLLGRLFNG